MSANVIATFTATSTQKTLTITIVGQGSVMKVPDKPSYEIGEIVKLYAIAAVGWKFTSWTGSVIGTISPADLTI